MAVGVKGLLVLIIFHGAVSALDNPPKYEPGLAMKCGKATQHRDVNTGDWISGDRDCINSSEELLDYCKQIYKGVTITTVLEEDSTVYIPHWCNAGHSPPCRGHGHSVHLLKCVVGNYVPTPTEVDEGCVRHHEVDHTGCFSQSHWRDTAAQLCAAKGKTMSKPVTVKSCDIPDTFHGVEFFCCRHPLRLSTPKPQKGKKPSELLRSVVVDKHSAVDEDCLQPREIGRCRGAFPRWYYDPVSQQCELFVFGGCGANANNFETELDCMNKCIPKDMGQVDSLIDNSFCGLPRETGPCRAAFRKYYYDAEAGKCMEFVFGGCDGNKNQFDMEEDCQRTCAGYRVPSLQPVNPGIPVFNPGPVLPDETMDISNDLDPSSTTTTTTTTESTTTPPPPEHSEADESTTLDTEHGAFVNKLDGMREEQQDRRDEILARFQAETAGLDSEAKSQKENEMQESLRAIEEEYAGKIGSLKDLHMDKMNGLFERERTKALQKFIDAVKAENPDARHVAVSLEEYVDVERKDKSHILQLYYMALNEEFDKGSILDFKLRMTEIDTRISKARTVLGDHPVVLTQIEEEVDEIFSNVPSTPDFEDTADNNVGVDRCSLPKEVGLCKALITAFYFDADAGVCEQFQYGGCGGNDNRFESLEDCQNACPDIPDEFDNVDANGVLQADESLPEEVVILGPLPDADTDNEFDIDNPVPAETPRSAESFIQKASTGTNLFLLLGLTALVVLVIVVAIIGVIKRNHTRTPTKIIVDKNNPPEKELTPEEKQLLALQQNGYENPTYKLLERKMS